MIFETRTKEELAELYPETPEQHKARNKRKAARKRFAAWKAKHVVPAWERQPRRKAASRDEIVYVQAKERAAPKSKPSRRALRAFKRLFRKVEREPNELETTLTFGDRTRPRLPSEVGG